MYKRQHWHVQILRLWKSDVTQELVSQIKSKFYSPFTKSKTQFCVWLPVFGPRRMSASLSGLSRPQSRESGNLISKLKQVKEGNISILPSMVLKKNSRIIYISKIPNCPRNDTLWKDNHASFPWCCCLGQGGTRYHKLRAVFVGFRDDPLENPMR